jgi:uncharacterized C2H2 Zn-finger protein
VQPENRNRSRIAAAQVTCTSSEFQSYAVREGEHTFRVPRCSHFVFIRRSCYKMLNSKHENLANREVPLVTRFYYAKNVRPAAIHGWLLKCVVRVQ